MLKEKMHASDWHAWNDKINSWVKEAEEFFVEKEHKVVKKLEEIRDHLTHEVDVVKGDKDEES